MTDMALLKYFKRIDSKKPEKVEAVLPKTDGPLATLMPVSSIEAANKAVRAQMMENALQLNHTKEKIVRIRSFEEITNFLIRKRKWI